MRMKLLRKVALTLVVGTMVLASSLNTYAKDIGQLVKSPQDIKVSKEIKIVGLGEATHGNVELQQLKKEVFEALVKNNGCRIFAIEGDFGGGIKVNDYILGGKGTAKEAVNEIGFGIYNTQQIVDLVQWMRDYNEQVSDDQKLHFYGFDMQRYNNSKAYLLNYLQKVEADKAKEYKEKLEALKDEDNDSIKPEILKKIEEDISDLMKHMELTKNNYIAKSSQKEFDMAYECANSLKQNTVLDQSSSLKYNQLRDGYMKEKVDWIYNYEGKKLLFINGHNGHIQKDATLMNYASMGSKLDEEWGTAYYAIGTDFYKGTVSAVNSKGEIEQYEIINSNALSKAFYDLSGNYHFIDFKKLQDNNDKLAPTLNKYQSMISIGAQFDTWQKWMKVYYTQNMIPNHSYNAMIFINKTTPTVRLSK